MTARERPVAPARRLPDAAIRREIIAFGGHLIDGVCTGQPVAALDAALRAFAARLGAAVAAVAPRPLGQPAAGRPRIYHPSFTRPLVRDGPCDVCDRPYDDGRCRLLRITLVPSEVVRTQVYAVATVDCTGSAQDDVCPCPCGPHAEPA